MNCNPQTRCKGARFTEDRLHDAARRVALIKAQQDLEVVRGIARMLDDFEQIAIDRGLPEGAYETFERIHYEIGNALVDLIPRIEKLKAYGF